jgi:hypothetical protein
MLRKKIGKNTINSKIIGIMIVIVFLIIIRGSTSPFITKKLIDLQEISSISINGNILDLPQFSVGQWGMDTHLSNANASFIGENSGDNSGRVAAAGDVNNDGYDDILIGASSNNEGGYGAGQTYLILGRPTANWQMDLDLSAANASFIGEGSYNSSGVSVAGAGDVNNDGFDDILIGAIGSCEGGFQAGQTYLILGRPTANWQMDLDLSEANASFIGEESFDMSGYSVAGAGDVNNDGYDDILIGAPYNDEKVSNAGQTYLILGRPTVNWQMDLDLSAASASFLGENDQDLSGSSVAGAGDVNKDGYDDILIGAQENDESASNSGQTYLILGRPTVNWQMDLDLSAASASFLGEDSYDSSGMSVAGAGDVNKDGYDDILIGAPDNEDGGFGAGQTYLILGRPTAKWQMNLDLSEANASFIGEDSGDRSGGKVVGAGDVNNDSYDDILIAAALDEEGGYDAGQTYLIFGQPTAEWQMDLDLSEAIVSFIGEDSDDRSGGFVAGAGDVNKDGYDDILIGAYGDEEGGTMAGQTYLILGDIRVDITSPTETTYVQNSVTLVYRVSDSTVTIYIDDEANTTALPSGSIISGLSDGSHNITIVAIDILGNVGKATVIFNVDTTPPTVVIDSPTAMTYPTDTITVDLSGDATHYWYYIAGIDGVNQTWATAIQRSLGDGSYTLHAYGNDSAGNEAHTSVTFTIEDITPPTVVIDSPIATIYPTDIVTVDLSGDAIHYWYYIAGVDGANQTWTTAIQRSLGEGFYTLHAYGNDSVGNEAHTSVTFTIDTTPPTVTIDSPTTTTYSTATITVDLSGDATHYWYYIAGVDGANQTWTTAIQRSLVDGSYTLHAYGNDSAGNEAHTSMSFTIDTTPPTVTVDSPTATTYSTDTITVDFSGDAIHYWYYITGIDGVNQTWTSTTLRSLADGSYTLHAYGNDTIGNEAHISVSFTIDTTPPSVTVDSPIATVYPTNTITVDLSGDAIYYWYYIAGVDGVNQTWTTTIQRSLADGSYTLHAYGNDTIGNEAHISVSFTIDTTPPTVTIDSPTATPYPTDTVTVDLSGDAVHYWYYIVGVDRVNQTWTSRTQRSLDDGSYILYAYGNDTVGNEVRTSVKFTIDTIPPSITIDSPTTMAYPTDTITIDLSGDAAHYWYYIAGVDGDKQIWVSTTQRSLSDGSYTLHAYGNDSAGNEAHTSVNFTIDTTPPTIDHPDDIIYIEGVSPNNIIWNPADNNPGNYTVTRNGVIVDSGLWDGGSVTISIKGLSAGNYTFVCTVYDKAGNSISETVLVSIPEKVDGFPWLPMLLLLSFATIGSGLVVISYLQRESLKKGISIITDRFRRPKEDI